MYAAIRRYNAARGASQTIVDRVNDEFLPRVKEEAGFVAYYVVDPGDGTLVSVSLFDDRAGAERSTRSATAWVRERLGHLITTAPVIITGEVAASAAAALR